MMEEILLSFRLFTAIILILAGLGKVAGRRDFREGIEDYAVLPAWAAPAFAVLIPSLELGTGILLLLGLFTAYAAAVALVLLGAFIVATLVNLARGREVDCHCFSHVLPERIGWASLTRQVIMILALVWIAANGPGYMALDGKVVGPAGLGDGPVGLGDLVPSWILASLAVLVYLYSTQLHIIRHALKRGDESHGYQQ